MHTTSNQHPTTGGKQSKQATLTGPRQAKEADSSFLPPFCKQTPPTDPSVVEDVLPITLVRFVGGIPLHDGPDVFACCSVAAFKEVAWPAFGFDLMEDDEEAGHDDDAFLHLKVMTGATALLAASVEDQARRVAGFTIVVDMDPSSVSFTTASKSHVLQEASLQTAITRGEGGREGEGGSQARYGSG